MKNKIYYFLGFSLLITSLIILIVTNKKKDTLKLLTLESVNSFLYHKEQLIEIAIYTNDESFPIDNLNTYSSVKVTDKSMNKILPLELLEVTYSHSERFINKDFFKYYLKFKMPNLNNNYSIKEAYLNITFTNNKEVVLSIGDFDLIYLDDGYPLNWINIDSKKEHPNSYSIKTIKIELEDFLEGIKCIYFSNKVELDYEIDNFTLKIRFNDLNKVFTFFPLVIETSYGSFYLNNHHYSIEYNLLENSGRLINIYELS